MRNENYNKIKAVVWDLDGTLYPWNVAFWEEDFNAVAKSVEQLGILSFEEGLQKAKQSFDMYHLTFEIFINRYGASFEELEAIHVDKYDVSKLTKVTQLIDFFKKSDGKQHYIVSDAPRKWVYKVLKALDYDNTFLKSHILTKENLPQRKQICTDWIENIRFQEQCTQRQILIVDNSKANLQPLRKKGYLTFLIDESNYLKSVAKLLEILSFLPNSN